MQEHEEPEIIICRGPAECTAALQWPCPLCFSISVHETWMVEEIIADLQHTPPQMAPHAVECGGSPDESPGARFLKNFAD